MSWTNSDGLKILYGTEAGEVNRAGFVEVDGARNVLKVIIDTSDMSGTTGQTVTNVPNTLIPSGALVTKATLTVLTAFTSGGSATLDIGLIGADGSTAVDLDGIDAAIALTALNAVGKQVTCDGALINGVALTADGQPYVKAGTAAFTAGKAELLIEYRPSTTA